MVRFSARTVQKPDPLLLGSPNPDPYPSTIGFCRIWLHQSSPISDSAFQVQFMVASRYPTVKGKILTTVCCCDFWIYWPPLQSKNEKWHDLCHPGIEHQRSVNNIWSFILCNMRGDWFQIVINKVLACWIGKIGMHTLPARC